MTDDERISRVHEAIEAELGTHYREPAIVRWTTLVSHALGGPDPLDSVEVYPHPDGHWHYVSLGMSELGGKRSKNAAVSGWGFELTFALSPSPSSSSSVSTGATPAREPPIWPRHLLNRVARDLLADQHGIDHGHYIERPGDPAGRFWGVVRDPVLRPVDTANGRFEWLQLVALAEGEFRELQGDDYESFLAGLAQRNPFFVTAPLSSPA